jgi:RNA polymerase sigma factor (sigma-70 family)
MVALPSNRRFLRVILPAHGILPLNEFRPTVNQEFQANEEARQRLVRRDDYARATSLALSAGALETMISEARPQVLRRLRQKGVEGADLEDLCAETLERFLQALQRREAREQAIIEHPTRYALSVTDTVFDDHLRRIRPHWCRLKRRVLYLLDDTHARGVFRRWKSRANWIGGFARWTDHPFRPNARYHALCSRPTLFCRQELGEEEPAQVPLPSLMAHLFRWLGTPLEVDELTNHLAALQNIRDVGTLSLEDLAAQNETDMDNLLPASPENVANRVLDGMQDEDFRVELWEIVCALPPRQRAALLLGMETDELLLAGTISDIARTLELSVEQLHSLWHELPLSDGQIAQRLEVTPKQVSNLRKCARERIARWLAKSKAAEE